MAVSIFGATKISAPTRNVFDLSHSVKTSTNTGYLVPVACIPVVPGDSFNLDAQVYCRLAPMVFPTMANVDVKLEAFYVPNRLTWPNWEKFIVFERRPNDDPKPVLPYLDLRGLYLKQQSDNYNRVGVGSLADYLGLPVTRIMEIFQDPQSSAENFKVNALPFAAYQKIWMDYYADKNIQQSLIDEFYKGNGELSDGDNTTDYFNLATLHHRMWRKDYFTSALPNAQRGADVLIPVNQSEVSISYQASGSPDKMRDPRDGSVYQSDGRQGVFGTASGDLQTEYNGAVDPLNVDNSGSLKGSLSSLNSTITDLRTAMQTQRLLELSMRVGSRLKEQLLGIFGVKSSDSRLDRAEFLGSSTVPIMMSEVAQTSGTTSTSPQGNLAGRGTAAGICNFKRSYFEEHGYLMVLMSVVPRASYFQGMPRHFRNFLFTDFYWPMFQHIGEQAIKKEELYYGTDYSHNQETFGYAPRYSDYKWLPSHVTGEMRDSLLDFHMARVFSNRPLLNTDFLDIKGDVGNRVFALRDNSYHHFWFDLFFKIKAKRPMDYFGSPK